jgi:transcriptional regulator with XRE-family HTH domain
MSLMNDYDRNSEETKKNLKNFGSRIQELRKKNNLTQSELAEKIGLSTNFIGMVERGERNTSVDKIFKLAKAFNVSLAQFFETL